MNGSKQMIPVERDEKVSPHSTIDFSIHKVTGDEENAKRSDEKPTALELLEQLTRGFHQSKRMFLAVAHTASSSSLTPPLGDAALVLETK